LRLGGRLVAGALLAFAGSVALAQAPSAPPPANPPAPATEAPDGKAILEGACTSCHGVDFIAERRKSRDDWEFTVSRMIDKGAALDEASAAVLVDYLAKTYPAEPKPASASPG